MLLSPSLRVYRHDRGAIDFLSASFVQSGRLVDMAQDDDHKEETFTLSVGRNRMTFFLNDFSEIFQGSDNARFVLHDALRHRDVVSVGLIPERPFYRNQAQYERACTAMTSTHNA